MSSLVSRTTTLLVLYLWLLNRTARALLSKSFSLICNTSFKYIFWISLKDSIATSFVQIPCGMLQFARIIKVHPELVLLGH